MKQGKGFFGLGEYCRECGKLIENGTADHPAYWAWEHGNYQDYRGWNSGRVYYHRSCARRVSKRRVAERERNMAEIRAIQKGARNG